MANWEYTITKGNALHQAIWNEDEQLVVKYLLECYKELYAKLTDEDKEWRGYDIEDTIFNLENFDEDEDVDGYLEEFYDLCDTLRAWITL